MVVLAASIVTKAGKPVISRQFREMPKARIESLLTSFPKLIPPHSQHTSIETSEVRYVYQPLEDLYILLITNKASNILQDIDTLHLFARLVAELCRSCEEKEILKNAFELLGAFDEIVSLGHREKINLTQVKGVLEMESHEEKIQIIIEKNKEMEAKQELIRRAKQMEMAKREAQRRAAQGLPPLSNMDFGTTPNSGGYTAGYSGVPRYDTPSPVPRTESPAPKPSKPVSFKGKGMKLGATKKSKQDEMMGSLGGEVDAPAVGSSTSGPRATATQSSVPSVAKENVHIQIQEHLSVRLARDSSLESLDLKGELHLNLSSGAQIPPIRISLTDPETATDLVFRQHPKVAKFNPEAGERVIQHKNARETFPAGQPLGLLRWKAPGKKDEGYLPLAINCWPTPANDGKWDITIEYELEKQELEIYDLTIEVPIPPNARAAVGSDSQSYSLTGHSLVWTVPLISSSGSDSTSGSLEFNVSGAQAPDAGAFFPVNVKFTAVGSLSEVGVKEVLDEKGANVTFSQERIVEVDEFLIG